MMFFHTINNIYTATNTVPSKQRTRVINNETNTNFQSLLENETWQAVHKDNDTNMVNSFLYTFINILKPVFQLNIQHELLLTERISGYRVHKNILEIYKGVYTSSAGTQIIQLK